ncbi:MAG: alpha/beta hydrolase [Pseudomonadota bacterium]
MARRLDLESEYNARMRVPEYSDIQMRWQSKSADFRTSRADLQHLDQDYGDMERQAYDLFLPDQGGDEAPLIVFIHGGYWQRGNRTDYACIAEPFVAAGYRVAVPSYRVCPDVAIAHIVGDIQEFLVTLYDRIPRRPLVIGHSAGGHLAAMALATDWSGVEGVPADLVTHAVAISGLFDLEPLLHVTENDVLCLTPETAEAVSPLSGSPPPPGRHLVAAVGAEESPEFIRQSLEVSGRWGDLNVTTECLLVPNSNHFTVLDELMRPGSGLFQRVCAMADAIDATAVVTNGVDHSEPTTPLVEPAASTEEPVVDERPTPAPASVAGADDASEAEVIVPSGPDDATT